MRLFKEILEKLFERKYIDKETKEKSNYDLLILIKILKKRRENKNCINMLKKKNMELDTFYKIITETDDLFYTEKELNYIYENILD